MKKRLIGLGMAMLSFLTLDAQAPLADIVIHEPKIEKNGEQVAVTFRAEIGRRTVKRNNSLVFAPVLTDDHYQWSLPAVIVRGKGADVLAQRHELASGRDIVFNDAFYAANGQNVDYITHIPYQLWMEGARLEMVAVRFGCCTYSEAALEVMAEELQLSPPVETVEAPEPLREPVVEKPLTTGEKLQRQFSFIAPYSDFEALEPGQIFDEDRENALTIYFRQGQTRVEYDFSDNARELDDLTAAVRELQGSGDSGIKAVVVAGFASPEGSFGQNDRLAWERAIAVKQFIMDFSGLSTEDVPVYNGSEDWRGLRMLIERSDHPWKESVLEIIDNRPVADAQNRPVRLNELQRLEGGAPYRYLLEHYFPLLRNAAYIKVYFENEQTGLND